MKPSVEVTNRKPVAATCVWLGMSAWLMAGLVPLDRPSRTADPSLEGFLDRVHEYVALRARLAKNSQSLKQTDTPVQIVHWERWLREALQRARAEVREGDVFGSAAPLFAEQLHDDWQGRSRTEQAGLLRELPPGYRPRINTVYPTNLPLVTFPPTLLERLPELPDGLEYRIVGPHLILRDANSNLIVDVLQNALTGDASRH